MSYEEVLKYQQNMVDMYKYKPVPPLYREDALRFYEDNIPEGFSLMGDNVPLFSPEGLKICSKYNRIVIGDYGAFIEIMPEDIIHENIKVKNGQEYRDFDERYSKHTKYSWLTTKDRSDVKIYFQKKTVDYADYVPGRYYISPYECVLSKQLSKEGTRSVFRDEISDWLNKNGVFSGQLLDYYVNLSYVYGDVLRVAVDNNVFPGSVDCWVKLIELCGFEGGLSFNQYLAVQYNLDLIECTQDELKGPWCELGEEVRTAILMGVEELPFPCDVAKLSSDEIRLILRMDVNSLLTVSRFSKVVAGCKGEDIVRDDFSVENVDKLIEDAEKRVEITQEKEKEYSLIVG